ncbi:MAG: FtsX-like permease family protein [Melioribacteraceae bacterium]|nr:MAG: FtsX-like permease family protein [Melioribacteraceae bacterium]
MKSNKKISPPFLAELIMKFFFPDYGKFTTLGDLNETFYFIAERDSLLKAKFWFWEQTLKSTIPLFINSFIWGMNMFQNYIKIAFRNLFKYKTYSAINILGLSVGLACTILIYLYTENELSFDKFQKDNENIYRLTHFQLNAAGNKNNGGSSTPAVLREHLPEFFGDRIERVTTLMSGRGALNYNGNQFKEDITYVESNFFEMFTFPLIIGAKESVLINENSIVLTERSAKKYFGEENPIGKDIEAIFGDIKQIFTVTGIAENPPSNSSIQFDFLINIENMSVFYNEDPYSHRLKTLGDFSAENFIKVKEGTTPQFFNKQFARFTLQYFDKELPMWRKFMNIPEEKLPFTFQLQNIKDIHFDTSISEGKDIMALYILIGIAFIVLFIACINFMNLSLGRSSFRFKEIGIRKVIGANRKQLLKQFWSESVLITLISMSAGIILSIIVMPEFNKISGKDFSVIDFFSPVNIAALILLSLIVGTIAGSYPSLIMSRAGVVSIMKGQFKLGGKNFFTKSLIVVQFALSILLMISTFILSDQIDYMINKDLGYNQDGIISVQLQELTPEENQKVAQNFKNKIANYSNIKQVSIVSEAFGGGYRAHSPFYYKQKQIMTRRINADYNFLETMKINLLQGRNFTKELSTDSSSVIINETCLKEIGLENPIGEEIKLFDSIPLKIIGVVKDFNFDPLREKVMPAIIYTRPDLDIDFALIKVSPQNINSTIKFLQTSWNEINPDKPFLFSFMNDDLRKFYEEDKKWQAIISYSSAFALIIACMGIFGLTAITITKKIKEIGIRKILGASVLSIINIILKEFALLIVIANLIAFPAAYYAMSKLLQQYYYRISVEPAYFISAGIISFSLAVIHNTLFNIKSSKLKSC